MNLTRIQQEIENLKSEFGYNGANSNLVKLGKVIVQNATYAGLVIKQVPVKPARFANKTRMVSLLILIPDKYPAVPPTGAYLDRPYDSESSHFTQNGYHGAPTLVDKGWYWACFGMGSNFNNNSGWRPTADPQVGHNLSTVFAAARTLINL